MSRQKPQYNSRQVLELAIEVDKTQGFIKSGFGYFDHESPWYRLEYPPGA